jgi:hypothetical protein
MIDSSSFVKVLVNFKTSQSSSLEKSLNKERVRLE